SAPVPVADYTSDLEQGVEKLRVGVPRHTFQNAPLASAAFLDAMSNTEIQLEEAGAVLSEVTLPDPAVFLACGRVINSAEIFSVQDRKSTRLNSSHVKISYAVFCLKKKTHTT